MTRATRSTAAAAALVLGVGLALQATSAAAAPPLVDDFESPLVSGTTAGGVPIGFYQAQSPGSTLAYDRVVPPTQVPDHGAENHALSMTATIDAWGVVVHAFEDETATQWVTEDWSPYAGMRFWFRGDGAGTTMFVDVIDNRPDGSTVDDAERWSASFVDDTPGWQLVELPFDSFSRKEIGNGAPNDGFQLDAVHGWAVGALGTGGEKTFYVDDVETYGVAPERPLTVGFTGVDFPVTEGGTAAVGVRLSKLAEDDVTVRVRSTTGTARPGVDYTPVDTVVTVPAGQREATVPVETIDNGSFQGERGLVLEMSEPGVAALGRPPVTRVLVTDDESRSAREVADFEGADTRWSGTRRTTASETVVQSGEAWAQPGQIGPEGVLELTGQGRKRSGAVTLPSVEDWSGSGGLALSYLGQGTGKEVSVTLGQATADPAAGDPSAWPLVWSDEFDGRAGTAPDPDRWTHEVGDGTIIGKPGWGNDELQYYTDSTDNAAHDGEGHLVVTTRENTDEDLLCYYGTCRYTSARLVSQYKAEFEYGRIETRVRVPVGDGLWPAFWALGTDIPVNPWPASGEIDIMENVGRDPDTLFGTIHGPGYSGGQSFGGTWDFGGPMADEFHTVAVDWSPGQIVWTVDGRTYHEAVPADVAPNEWVFEHPFFLLINTAVGGNFGGAVGADTTFPQEYVLDYVRVYQGDRQERTFTGTFTDDSTGWREVTLPWSDFAPDAPRSTAVLDPSRVSSIEVAGRSGRANGSVVLDDLRLTCAEEVVAETTADSGPGSLRAALAATCDGGTVRVSDAVAGQTVLLESPLSVDGSVTVEAGGLVLDGQGSSRVLETAADSQVSLSHASLTHGYGSELGGAVVNNGSLSLTEVRVVDNAVTTTGNDFWKGGGGIYTGEGGSLTLTRSTVADNTVTDGPAGGLYGFFGSTLTVVDSTVSGNTATDVAGGIRSLGTLEVTNSTVSGNSATGWHGGGIFVTDGTATISYSTVTANTSPGGTTGGLFVGTFGDSAATLVIDSSIVEGNSGPQCFAAYFGAGAVQLTSAGHNVLGDDTCGSGDGDLVGSAGLGELADNGGPTLTHLPAADGPSVGRGNPATAPGADQRGTARDSAPDAGSVEVTS
jgi:beta-glucanase (GH16 family)